MRMDRPKGNFLDRFNFYLTLAKKLIWEKRIYELQVLLVLPKSGKFRNSLNIRKKGILIEVALVPLPSNAT